MYIYYNHHLYYSKLKQSFYKQKRTLNLSIKFEPKDLKVSKKKKKEKKKKKKKLLNYSFL